MSPSVRFYQTIVDTTRWFELPGCNAVRFSWLAVPGTSFAYAQWRRYIHPDDRSPRLWKVYRRLFSEFCPKHDVSPGEAFLFNSDDAAGLDAFQDAISARISRFGDLGAGR